MPYVVDGYPTNFIKQEDDTLLMALIEEGRINHFVSPANCKSRAHKINFLTKPGRLTSPSKKK